MGGTAKHLKIGRLKSVLPENLLIRQLSDLAFGSRFVYNCPSACFSEINIVPRTAPSTQCQQKKVTSIHVLGRSFIRMKCLAAFHAKPQATPLSAIMNVVHCESTPAWLKIAVAGTGAWEFTLCCSCSNASNDLIPQRKCKLTQPQIWKSRPRGKSIFKNRRQN